MNAGATTERYFDAHCHLQDARLGAIEPVLDDARRAGLARAVVNGTSEADWPKVRALADRFPDVVLPSFGLHPWFVRERSPRWLERLEAALGDDAFIGETGLDRWIRDPDLQAQEEVFVAQLALAAKRNSPLSVHCLKAWGWLQDLLEAHERPERGFLLHSYAGSAEMLTPLLRLGAWFSFSGYFLHPRKQAVRDTFRQIPLERILVETDAPDQCLPENLDGYPEFGRRSRDGNPRNHPANLPRVYRGLAEVLGISVAALRDQVAGNFERFFSP